MFYQNTIIKKYLAMLNEEQVKAAWEQYKALFLNQIRQDNIHASKEEQFQEGFLRDLFVKTLGYTINPDPDFNLITEKKNETDSRKADGAIQRDGKVIGIIELKDHKTPNLKQVETQAFGYKNQHRGTRYVIISNFEKLRFYIDDATEFREWDLFSLKEEDFKELYFCLSWGTLSQDLPIKAKTESVSNEDQITQQLYKDYSAFKREVFADILKNNTTDETPKEQILLLFKKTQKLLDRLLFIFFAEDCELLPPNMILQIIGEWEQLKALDAYTPLYDRIKKYFGYLDSGNESKNIFAYNGGLFKPDEELDRLTISDEVLARFTRKLSEYDYASEVDVNILGHIFENSLSEIEEVTAQINAGEAPTVSKRKRDGVFYTPQYITKYIVENTVGRLCAEKKAELGIEEDEYFADKNRQMATKKRLLDKLDAYRKWLKGITICDPACGSGAFLNAALHFLIDEHKLLDEMDAKVRGAGLVFPDVENYILEENLYGVDINEESVEIARLALWLRTAKKCRKLSSLNNNIKCGNSLISDPEIAGEKAFDWQKEFPQVFEKGGFDVVIGNPPYVRAELLPQADLDYYRHTFKAFTPDGDLFSYFYEQGLNIMRGSGIFAFISNTFDKTSAGKVLRSFIQENASIQKYVDFTEVQVFEGATTYPIILVLKKDNSSGTFPYIKIPKSMQGSIEIQLAPEKQVEQHSLNAESWSFQSSEMVSILRKIAQFKTVKDQYGKCYRGLLTGLNDAFFIDETKKNELIEKDPKSAELIKPVYEGKDLHKWYNSPLPKYLLCTHNGYENTPAVDVDQYPAIKEYLSSFEPQLSKRYDKGNTPYNLRNCAYQPLFYKQKIIWGNLQNTNKFSFDESGTIVSAPTCMLPTSNKALLCVLNSRIVWTFLTSICVVRSGGYIEVKPQYFEQIPIPAIEGELAEQLSILADEMLALNKELQETRSRFIRRLQDNIPEVKINGALEAFDSMDFNGFVSELKKQKIRLSLFQQDEWEKYFNKNKLDCEELSAKIAETDKEINARVYTLYGLEADEIKLIEQ